MRCEATLPKVEAIIWIFTQNKFSNLMRCEAKLARVEAIYWNAHAEQVQQLDALAGKTGKKVETINWNAYAEQVQQLDALWGKTRKSRGY